MPAETERLRQLQQRLEHGILKQTPTARIQGANVPRLPNTTNVAFANTEGETLLMSLDLQGVVVTGDVALEQLPRQPIDHVTLPSQEVRRMLDQVGIEELRIIPGSLSIRDSIFQGNLATNLRKGRLVILGAMDRMHIG